MKVQSIHRWQWMIIGVAVGLLCGWLRDMDSNFADELATYGRRIGQRDFERGIVNKFHGRAQFSNIVVHPYRLSGSSAGAAHVDVVEGLYFDGQTQMENGKLAARWEPAYFVASTPYRPVTAVNGASVPVTRPAATASFDNVTSYLASLPKSAGVQYRYDSLAWLTRPVFIWSAGGFVLVGIIWPTIVNLLVFGSIRRPKEQGLSLRGIKGTSTQARPSPAPLEEAVASLDDELEHVLSDQPALETPSISAVPVRKLDAEQVTAAAAPSGPQKEFGAHTGDYYPTELAAGHQNERK